MLQLSATFDTHSVNINFATFTHYRHLAIAYALNKNQIVRSAFQIIAEDILLSNHQSLLIKPCVSGNGALQFTDLAKKLVCHLDENCIK